jgi:hypothetical protein
MSFTVGLVTNSRAQNLSSSSLAYCQFLLLLCAFLSPFLYSFPLLLQFLLPRYAELTTSVACLLSRMIFPWTSSKSSCVGDLYLQHDLYYHVSNVFHSQICIILLGMAFFSHISQGLLPISQ